MMASKPSLPIAVILAVFAIPTGTSAQNIPVRTGEHATFTRIVLDFSTRPEWRLGRNGERHELHTGDRELGFDLSDAFRRIGENRIAELVDLGEGQLGLGLACDCSLSVEELPNQGLLIDVVDGPPETDNPWEQVLDVAPGPPVVAVRPAPTLNLPVILPPLPSVPTVGPFASVDGKPLTESELAQVENLLQGLMQQTSRAASQGLVQFDITTTAPAVAMNDGGMVAALQPEPMSPEQPANLSQNIIIETQFDRDSRSIPTRRARIQSTPCIQSNLVDVGEWYDADTVQDGLGEARMRLEDSRDRSDPSAYADLARKLIFLTFGPEAIALLKDGPEGVPGKDLLLELAGLMGSDQKQTPGLLASQLNCDSPAALWAVLATSDLSSDTELNTPMVVQTVSAMPLHLRQYLGPRVANRLIESGDAESALAIRNAILRGAGSEPPEVAMLEARLDMIGGDSEAAKQSLETVAASRNDQAAQALKQLIERHISDDEPVQIDLLEQSAALAFELSNTYMGSELSRAIVLAHIQNQDYETALRLASDLQRRGAITEIDFESLRTGTLSKLGEQAEDPIFLPIALKEIAKADISDPARVPIAARLARLGMPGPARKALGTRADIPRERERYVLAEIAILEGKKGVAESYLTGLESDEAERLRIRAMSIRDSGDSIQPNRTLAASDNVVDGSVIMADRVSEGVLARNRELLSESRAIRDTLQALLRDQGN